MKTIFISTIVISLAFSNLLFSQSRETGAILGRILDDQGNLLPGATILLTGEKLMGSRNFVVDAQGAFRFPALPPGQYALQAEMPGFKTVVQENIRLTTTTSLTIDLVLTPAAMAVDITVNAVSPTVDIKSTETGSITLPDEILRNIPYSEFTVLLVNFVPGVTDNVAYGASQYSGIAWTVDGVDVSDPNVGGWWVYMDTTSWRKPRSWGWASRPNTATSPGRSSTS
jgi:hypothetical protein